MLVFHPKDLPPDPIFPENLEELGYFVNSEDQIRKISDPEQPFQFKISTNERWNEMQKGAMNACIRGIVLSRLSALDLKTVRLPLGAGPDNPHVPILVSSNIATASRIFVVFGEPDSDLGIWTYRTSSGQSINEGSAVAFSQAILGCRDVARDIEHDALVNPSQKDTALVLANAGQLIWHCGSSTAMTMPTWLALPRKSAVDLPPRMTYRNKIPRNGNCQEHVECIFEEVLTNRGFLIRNDVKMSIIGLGEGGSEAMNYLAGNWQRWSNCVDAICLSNPMNYLMPNLTFSSAKPEPDEIRFSSFVSSRCRAYVLSDMPIGHPIPRTEGQICNYYSSGEALNRDCIVPSAWRNMLAWLDRIHADASYEEVEFLIREHTDNCDVGGDEGSDL